MSPEVLAQGGEALNQNQFNSVMNAHEGAYNVAIKEGSITSRNAISTLNAIEDQLIDVAHDEALVMNEAIDTAANSEAKAAAVEARVANESKGGFLAGLKDRAANTVDGLKNSKIARSTAIGLGAVALFAGGAFVNNNESVLNAPAQAAGLMTGGNNSGANASNAKNSRYDLEGAKTVNGAVKNLEFKTAKGAMATILENPSKYDGLKNSHALNKQVGLKDFKENMSNADAGEAWALGVVNDPKVSQDRLNDFEGKSIETPRSDTQQQRVGKIRAIVTSEGTTLNGNYKLNGAYANGYIKEKTGELGSHPANFRNVRALEINPGVKNADTTYAKVGGIEGTFVCINSENKLKLKFVPNAPVIKDTPRVSVPMQPGQPGQPPRPNRPGINLTTPNRPEQPQRPQTPTTPETPQTPETPTTPETPETPPVTPPVTPPTEKTPEKHDNNTTPGGVPGHNGGTPDNAGDGPAGQTPDNSGFVPGEQHPTTPEPQPTPAPLPTQPEPQAPAETGPLAPPTGPATPGAGSGNPTPTTDVEIK